MKTALEYLQSAHGVLGLYRGGAVPISEALAAVQAALDDATKEAENREKYRQLLAMAIINSQPQTA